MAATRRLEGAGQSTLLVDRASEQDRQVAEQAGLSLAAPLSRALTSCFMYCGSRFTFIPRRCFSAKWASRQQERRGNRHQRWTV